MSRQRHLVGKPSKFGLCPRTGKRNSNPTSQRVFLALNVPILSREDSMLGESPLVSLYVIRE